MTALPIWTLARLTWREALRRKVVLAGLLLGVVFLAVYGAGSYFIRHEMVRDGTARRVMIANQMYNFLMLSALYVVNFLVVALAVLISVDTLAGEIASGTIHTLAAKPLRRWQILIGKWIGLAAMLTFYLLLLAGGVIWITDLTTGYQPSNVVRGLALIWLNGMLMLHLSLLGGTRLSTLANGVFVFAAFGISFIGGWVEQIGSLLNSESAVNVGVVTSLLIPSESLWRRAAYEMRSLIVDVAGFSPFTSATSVPSTAMLIYAIVYALVGLALAVWSLERRDL